MGINGVGSFSDERLLQALAGQLKLPLLQIARQAELALLANNPESYRSINYTADMAIRLIDSYLLSIDTGQLPVLALEPVSVSATLQETAHLLNPLAKQYNCDLEVHLSGKYQPVMAHKLSLEAALSMLAQVFVESIPESGAKHRVILGAHKTKHGLVTGIFGNQVSLNSDALIRGRALFGTADQALPGLSPTGGAGVFVADALMSSMNSPLHTSRHKKFTGLAATLTPSQQLQLI